MKNTVVVLIFSLGWLTMKAQESEFKSWNAVEYGMDINKKWSIDFSQHFRLKDNLEETDNIITQTGLLQASKTLESAVQLRYNYRNDTNGGIQGFENMLRYRVGVEKIQNYPGILN